MACLAAAMPFLLRNEGGDSDLKGDPGARTRCGISTPELADFNRRHPDLGYPSDPWELNHAQIATIYDLDFWRYDGIQDQRVATKLFDIGVNVGLGTEVHILQRLLGVTSDGVYGPATEAAVNAREPLDLLKGLCEAAKEHYLAVAKAHPDETRFLDDWERRAEEMPA